MPLGIKTGPTRTSSNQRNKDVGFICGENDSGERSRAIMTLLLFLSSKRSENIEPSPKQQVFCPPKQKEFADNNFKFDGTGWNFFKRVENPMGKEEIGTNFSFSHSVFKRFVMQTSKNRGQFGKGLGKRQKHCLPAFFSSPEHEVFKGEFL